MNLIDRAVNFLNPVAGLKRQAARQSLSLMQGFSNSGYGDHGASYHKRALKGFTARSKSPSSDIDTHHKTLVSRSRSLYMGTTIASSAIKTINTNVVGSGLRLKSNIDADFLGLTPEQAQAWQKKTEREFNFWANTRLCDALKMNNFYEMQGLILKGQLLNGDGFCLLKTAKPTNFMPYALRLQVLEGDRVCTPDVTITSYTESYLGFNKDNGNRIVSGVEIDSNGATLAYHIVNQYFDEWLGHSNKQLKWDRVLAYGEKTGRPNILHIFDAERPEQRRGVPLLAPVIEELQQLKRYTDAELMAAVINGMFTAFITTNGDTTDIPFGVSVDAPPVNSTENEYELGTGAVVNLAPGEQVEIADPKRPSTAFDGFVSSLCKNIGAALELPVELLQKSFTSSYSASRAALLEAWKMFRMRREWMSREFCTPVYEMFLTEAVARGRIKAQGFFDDPIVRASWCKADWNGASMGMIDPKKEVQAAALRVNYGFSTHEEETMGLTGGDFNANVRQLKRENELLAEAQVVKEDMTVELDDEDEIEDEDV